MFLLLLIPPFLFYESLARDTMFKNEFVLCNVFPTTRETKTY